MYLTSIFNLNNKDDIDIILQTIWRLLFRVGTTREHVHTRTLLGNSN